MPNNNSYFIPSHPVLSTNRNFKPSYTKNVLPISEPHPNRSNLPTGYRYVAKVHNYQGKVAIKLKNGDMQVGDIIAVGYNFDKVYTVLSTARMSHFLIGVYEIVSTADVDSTGTLWGVTNTPFPTCASNFSLNNNTVMFTLYDTLAEASQSNLVVNKPKIGPASRTGTNYAKHNKDIGARTIDGTTGQNTACSSLLLDSYSGTDKALINHDINYSNGFKTFSVTAREGTTNPPTSGSSDTTPPTVSTSPEDEGNIGVSDNITFNFTEAIDPLTVKVSNFRLRHGANVNIPFTVTQTSPNVVVMNPTNNFNPVDGFSVQAGALRYICDLSGNDLGADYNFSYTLV